MKYENFKSVVLDFLDEKPIKQNDDVRTIE